MRKVSDMNWARRAVLIGAVGLLAAGASANLAGQECPGCTCFCNELAKECQTWTVGDDGPYEICVNDSVSCHDSGLCIGLADIALDGAVLAKVDESEWQGDLQVACGGVIVGRRYSTSIDAKVRALSQLEL